jgi:hypothetical protein
LYKVTSATILKANLIYEMAFPLDEMAVLLGEIFFTRQNGAFTEGEREYPCLPARQGILNNE